MHPNETRLNDYVEEALGAAERREVEQHLETCGECRALIDDLRAIRATAASLDRRDPPARAWLRLERAITLENEHRAEIGARDVEASGGAPRPRARAFATYTWLGAAAAVVLAVFIGLKLRPASSTSPEPATPTIAATNAPAADASAQSVEAELRAAEDHYEKAIRGLEQVTNSEKGALDPQTSATLQKNLAVIDQAISESRAAVRAQPASQPAQDSLIDSFKAKLALLQDTVALINEMRKGNDAGAARIGSGLTKKG
ncbi:MAG TPA: zf-HC2 domain-containing protein [Vicinamibacterales bacterium]|nr:zf-HC2 domain-containing protein [Vicinamibacterales bacterium]